MKRINYNMEPEEIKMCDILISSGLFKKYSDIIKYALQRAMLEVKTEDEEK